MEIDKGLLSGLFSSQIPAPRYDLREAKMIAKAQEKVMLSTDWINASELLELISSNHLNKNASINLLKDSKKIFGVVYRGEDLFPIYILDKHNGYSPYSGLKPVLELFSGVKNNWGCAYWFASANGFLNGARPQDFLAANPEAVLAAAKIELEGITHG